LQLNGVTAGSANTDFVFPRAPPAYAPPGANVNGWHGSKGEGIAGTPMFVQSGVNVPGQRLPPYPAERRPMAAWGVALRANAGGGGTDAEAAGRKRE